MSIWEHMAFERIKKGEACKHAKHAHKQEHKARAKPMGTRTQPPPLGVPRSTIRAPPKRRYATLSLSLSLFEASGHPFSLSSILKRLGHQAMSLKYPLFRFFHVQSSLDGHLRPMMVKWTPFFNASWKLSPLYFRNQEITYLLLGHLLHMGPTYIISLEASFFTT